jgi:hypothetical protein
MNQPALRISRLWSLSIACAGLQLLATGPSVAAQAKRLPPAGLPAQAPTSPEKSAEKAAELEAEKAARLLDALNAAPREYTGWAVGDVDVHPPQPKLVCPAGSFIRSVSVTQDEWLAHIGIYCQTPDKLVSTDPREQMSPGTPGPDAGGDGGSGAHSATLTCPSSFVDGLTGLVTHVRRTIPLVLERFAADPRFFCGTYAEPGATVLKDEQFRRSGDDAVRYQEMNSIYPTLQANFRCPRHWAATGIWYKLGGAKRDDIQAFGLICAALPAPPGSKAIMRRGRS